MFPIIDPNAEAGPAGMFVFAGILTLVACGVLISGLHPRWRDSAKWQGGVPRSPFGSVAFAIGLLIMSAGLLVRGIRNEHGPFAGATLGLFCCGMAMLLIGLFRDLIQNTKRG